MLVRCFLIYSIYDVICLNIYVCMNYELLLKMYKFFIFYYLEI